MNYKKIHDSIIHRARTRRLDETEYSEQHHVLPKCEGGLQSGETVQLRHREHRLVHRLRYKFTKVFGNNAAYNWMSCGEAGAVKNQKEAAKLSHSIAKNRDPVAYSERQRKYAKLAGSKCRDQKLGFHSMSEDDMTNARNKGNATVVSNKLGMFSDSYREKHKETLYKNVNTPSGAFNSMQDAARFYNVCSSTVTYRTGSDSEQFKEWYIIERTTK
jgi:hypothetical protein